MNLWRTTNFWQAAALTKAQNITVTFTPVKDTTGTAGAGHITTSVRRCLSKGRTELYPEITLVYYIGVDLMDDVWLIISLENGVVTGYTFDVT